MIPFLVIGGILTVLVGLYLIWEKGKLGLGMLSTLAGVSAMASGLIADDNAQVLNLKLKAAEQARAQIPLKTPHVIREFDNCKVWQFLDDDNQKITHVQCD